MIDPKVQAELRARYNPDGSELRAAQIRMKEMLVFLDGLCREHGLTYWLDSGTLLGAVRHGGFIPWDDDMDVAMPLKDARKLARLLRRPVPGCDFVVQSRRSDRGYFGAWFVLRDLRSEYIQDSLLHNRRQYKGIQIDIFPMEAKTIPCMTDFTEAWQRRLINHPMDRIRCDFLARLVAGTNYYLLHGLVIPLLRLLPRRKDRISLAYGIHFPWYSLPAESLLPVSRVMFEGDSFCAPASPETYLEACYGDWNSLPSQIKTHKVRILFK